MDIRFRPHNMHLEGHTEFHQQDPHLRQLRRQPLVYRFPLLEKMPVEAPGVYSVTGGRQIGKTTILKQWMADLLDSGVEPRRIAYFTGELIDDSRLVEVTGTTGEPTFLRGDANADGAVNIADAIFILNHLFAGDAAPACQDAADANDDGKVDIADAVAVLNHLFGGAGDLPAPFGECGADPTADALECDGFPPCAGSR